MTTKNNRVVLNLSQDDARKVLSALEAVNQPELNKIIQRIKKSLKIETIELLPGVTLESIG